MRHAVLPMLSTLLLSLLFALAPARAAETPMPDADAHAGHVAASASPQPGAAVAPDAFDQLDANHDGVLSRAELARHPHAAHMAMVDENRDGVLSREEFGALQEM